MIFIFWAPPRCARTRLFVGSVSHRSRRNRYETLTIPTESAMGGQTTTILGAQMLKPNIFYITNLGNGSRGVLTVNCS
ncbi:MAG: hypothetical protein IPQ18_09620 [Saprospiraceae bacterium]|nr:hypothetical protein [Saprospiraceae bacterium]